MGLISKYVEVSVCGKEQKYYESLGYEIPRTEKTYVCTENNKQRIRKSFTVTKGTKIMVKVEDLPPESSIKIKVKCDNCGGDYEISYINFTTRNKYDNGNGLCYCNKCYRHLFCSGKNHYNYDSTKTDEERIDNRHYPEYVTFIKSVLARDNYTCQYCGKISARDVVVHHLYSYTGFKQFQIDQSQAICLCETHHKLFHQWQRKKYGNTENKYCTREQYEEWCGEPIGDLQEYNGEIQVARPIFDIEENKSYQSAKYYSEIHNVNTSSVYDCCNHKVKQCKHKRKDGLRDEIYCIRSVRGHHLLWLDEYEKMSEEEIIQYLNENKHKSYKKVICITTNKIFDSIANASRFYSINSSDISRCCRGKIHTSGKLSDNTPLKWMYYDKFLELSQEEQDKLLSENKIA